jgi:predicted nuclease of predicted toxin-antitoxin system
VVRIVADMHGRQLGHDVTRVADVLAPTATDTQIVDEAIRDDRVILTQDLDFSALVAVSGRSVPSVVSLRLSSARVETVNARLTRVLPMLEADLAAGAIAVVEDLRVRTRKLPVR